MMKRIAAFTILAAFAAALLLAMLPAHPARAEPYGTFKYSVKITAGSEMVSVRMDYNADAGAESFDMLRTSPEQPWLFPELPKDYFQNVEAFDAMGNPISVVAEDNRWKVMGGGVGVVRYDVDLGTLRGLTPIQFGVNNPEISPYYPRVRNDYVFLPGYALFLMPNLGTSEEDVITDPYYFDISFDLPEGWQVFTSWEESPTPAQFALDRGLFAGIAKSVSVEGDAFVSLVQEENTDPANLAGQQELTDKLAAQVNMANEAWGKPGTIDNRLFFFLGRLEQQTIDNYRILSIPFYAFENCAFVPGGSRENILSTEFLLRSGEMGLGVMLSNLNLFPSICFPSESLWFREGCVHYSNLRFAQLNGWVSEDYVYDQLGSDYALYVDALAQSGTSLAGAGDQALQEPLADLLYGGGTIAVTSMDVELAAKGKSLDGFIGHLLQLPWAELTNQRILDELWVYAGLDMSVFFNDYVTGTATVPASAFSQLKLGGNTDGSERPSAGTDIEPAPAFGNGWILMAVAIFLVFAIPFLLEPYTLRPRGGAVVVTEEELETERQQLKKEYWGEHHGEEQGESSQEPEDQEPGDETPDDGGGGQDQA